MKQQLPPGYLASQSSPYRKRIARLGRPLDEGTRKKVDEALALGHVFFQALPRPNKILFDLEALMNMREKLRPLAGKGGIPPGSSPYDIYKKLFSDNSVFFESSLSDPGYVAGPLLGSMHIFGLDIFLVALTDASQDTVQYRPERPEFDVPARIFIDVPGLLEHAVHRINMYRYHQLEPIGSLMFSPHEAKDATQAAFARRLQEMQAEEELRPHVFRKLLSKLGCKDTNDKISLDSTFSRLFTPYFSWRLVRNTYADNEVEHTLNLCNSLFRSGLVAQLTGHSEIERLGREGNKPNIEYVKIIGSLADAAYCDPFFRLGKIVSDSFFYSDGLTSSLKEYVVRNTINQLGSQQSGILERLLEILNSPQESISEVAKRELDKLFRFNFGKSFSDAHPNLVEIFEDIRRMVFINSEHLPTIAEMWKERMG